MNLKLHIAQYSLLLTAEREFTFIYLFTIAHFIKSDSWMFARFEGLIIDLHEFAECQQHMRKYYSVCMFAFLLIIRQNC